MNVKSFLLSASACAFLATSGILQADPERAAGEWKTMASVPDQRTEVSVTTDGELIYLIGGFKLADDGSGHAVAPREMFAYNPEDDSWFQQGEILQGVNHAGFVGYEGKLYIIGGYQENTFNAIGHVRIYDIAEETWSEGASMITPRGALKLAEVNGKIHAIGGTAAGEGSVGTHEVYDPQADSWETLATMPTGRDHLAVIAIDGKIYVSAGRAGGNFTMTETEIYDPAEDSWSTGAPMPTGRSGVAEVNHRGRFYVFGGEVFGDSPKTFDEAERYDPETDSWQQLPPMPTARHGLGAASIGDHIYVISGGPQPGFAFGDANERLTPEDTEN
ncbi:MAG: kelch repeat-containing protein [Opitutales bacterium]